MLRDVFAEANGSGYPLVQDMYSAEGKPQETWSVKRADSGRFIVTHRGKHQLDITRFENLEALERGQLEDGGHVDVPEDVIAQTHYALEAIGETIKEAWNQLIVEKAVRTVSQ